MIYRTAITPKAPRIGLHPDNTEAARKCREKARKVSRIVLILCLLLSVVSATAADRNQGSATVLDGKIFVQTIFIGVHHFPMQEKRKFIDRLEEAETWLQEQAARYGKSIEFVNDVYGLEQTVEVDQVANGKGSGKEPTDILMPVMRKLGYAHHRQFYHHVMSVTPCRSCLVLIVADTPGRSYTVGYVEKANDKYFTECCMLYTCSLKGRPSTAATIAHEILHCFGAWDLYENFKVSGEQAAEAEIRYRDDIMHRVSRHLHRLNIGSLTAWRVGLTDEYLPEYDFFRPKRRSEKANRPTSPTKEP